MDNFKLDIDRLHAVFHGDLVGRGIGKTTAVCYQALGYCQISKLDVFILVESFKDYAWIKDQLSVVLDYEGIKFKNLSKYRDDTCRFILAIGDYTKEIIICTKEKYDFGLKYNPGEHLLLFDFVQSDLYGDVNSAQYMWSDLMHMLGNRLIDNEVQLWQNAFNKINKELFGYQGNGNIKIGFKF